MIDLPEFSPSWKFCPARTSREIFCPGPPGIASLDVRTPVRDIERIKKPDEMFKTVYYGEDDDEATTQALSLRHPTNGISG